MTSLRTSRPCTQKLLSLVGLDAPAARIGQLRNSLHYVTRTFRPDTQQPFLSFQYVRSDLDVSPILNSHLSMYCKYTPIWLVISSILGTQLFLLVSLINQLFSLAYCTIYSTCTVTSIRTCRHCMYHSLEFRWRLRTAAWLSGSASACCKAGPSSILGSAPQRGGLPTKLSSDEEMERGPSEWRRINVLYECDMNVCML